MSIVESVSDSTNLKKSRAGCYSRLKGRLKCSFLKTFHHFKKPKKCSKKAARNDPGNSWIKKSVSSFHWLLKRKRYKVRTDCQTGPCKPEMESNLETPREDSEQMKQVLVKRVERKLEELKALYTDSWSVFKGMVDDKYDYVSCDAVSKILNLLSKVKNDIFHSQGNFETEDVDKLEEMAGNLDELNSELLSMRDSYMPCLSRTVSIQLPKALEGSESLADGSDNSYNINRGDGNDCHYSNKGSDPCMVSYCRDITVEEGSRKWSKGRSSNYSKSFKALNRVATRLDHNGANKDRVCLGKILGTIEKVHQELYVQMLKSFKAQVEDVTQDLTRIKSRLIHLDESEGKTNDGDDYSVKRKPKRIMVNGVLRWESSVKIDSNRDDIEKKKIQTFITLFRQIKAFHKIVNKLDEIKRDYSALRKSPPSEGLKLYKRAEMTRLIEGLGYIKRKTQQMSLHFEAGDYQSTSGRKSLMSINYRCPINSEAGDSPMNNSIYKFGDEEHQIKEFESMPWDRGTNSLYQTMMYHPNFNETTLMEENAKFTREDFNDINKDTISVTSETCCNFRCHSTHNCFHHYQEENKISTVNLRPHSKQRGAEHFMTEQDASEESGSLISSLFVNRQTNQNNVATSNKKFNRLMNAGFRLLDSSLNKMGSDHSFMHRCDTKFIRNIANRPNTGRQMNNYALSIRESSFHSDTSNDIDIDTSTFKMESSNVRENDERLVEHGLENKFRKDTVDSDYSEVSIESDDDHMQDLPKWQKNNGFLNNEHSKPILRKLMKDKSSAYCQDIPELAHGKELYFKIECFNRATSITGLRGQCIINKSSLPPETWFKYSKLNSSVISFNHLPKKSIKIQTEMDLERVESNSEVYCVVHPCNETSKANSYVLQSKYIKRKIPSKKYGKHLPLTDSFWSNKHQRCQSNISVLFGEKSDSNKWLMNSKVLINSGPFK